MFSVKWAQARIKGSMHNPDPKSLTHLFDAGSDTRQLLRQNPRRTILHVRRQTPPRALAQKCPHPANQNALGRKSVAPLLRK